MSNPLHPKLRLTIGLVLVLGFAALAAGCQLMVDPFVDELAYEPAVTTPSAVAARAIPVARAAAQRSGTATHVYAKDGTVTHGPLYYVDPSEDPDCDDGLFAWSGTDYLESLYGPVRFLVNSVFLPLRAVARPPWQIMESSGPAHGQAN